MEEILRQLRNSTNLRLDKLDVEFSGTMQSSFDEVLIEAVQRMDREGRMFDKDIERASRNFNIFIDDLAVYAESQLGSDTKIIRFQALNESRKGICPLWPIC